MKKYINEALEKYIEKDTYPWHMPGHKRQRTGDALWSGIYAHDFTEAKDLDDMHEPESFIADSLEEMRRVYGTYRTYMLVNGSTSGIMTAVHAVCRRGDAVLVARNCHKSVYNAVCMLGLIPEYIAPDYVEPGIPGDISCEALKVQVEELKGRGVKLRAAVITSPTYEGVISDIEGIADLLHSHGIYLIVDEAQGAHLRFMSRHRTAMECGADIAIESLHKTMPALTQTSLLHVMTPELDPGVRRYLQIFQTSSPSYIFMQSMERAVAFGANERQAFSKYEKKLAEFRKSCAGFRNIKLLYPGDGGRRGVYDYDEGRLVFVIRPGVRTKAEIPFTGVMLSDMLADRYGLIVEMAAAGYVICISSVMDSEESYGALHMAVKEIDGELSAETGAETEAFAEHMLIPERKMLPAEAWDAPAGTVAAESAQGHIAGTFVYAYPPGIPIIVPGELIDDAVVSDICGKLMDGLSISGVSDGGLRCLMDIAGKEENV